MRPPQPSLPSCLSFTTFSSVTLVACRWCTRSGMVTGSTLAPLVLLIRSTRGKRSAEDEMRSKARCGSSPHSALLPWQRATAAAQPWARMREASCQEKRTTSAQSQVWPESSQNPSHANATPSTTSSTSPTAPCSKLRRAKHSTSPRAQTSSTPRTRLLFTGRLRRRWLHRYH